MIITAIEKSKGNRYTVYVDGEYWYILDAEILLQNGLRVNMEVDGEYLDGLLWQAQRRKARERAYYLLGYRDHSSKELYDKLLRSVKPEIAAETVALMQEQGYLDDEAYAQKLAQYYLEGKHWGEKRAVMEMARKGIDRETAMSAVSACGTDPVAQICAVIDKKYAGYLIDGDYKGQQKVIAALLRLGFSYSDVRTAIQEYTTDQLEEAEW